MKEYKVTVETGIKSTTTGVQPEVSEFSYSVYADDLDEAMSLAYNNVAKLRRNEPTRFYSITEVVEV
jgi:hypothetical protein